MCEWINKPKQTKSSSHYVHM